MTASLLAAGCSSGRTFRADKGALNPRQLDDGLPRLAVEARPGILDVGVAELGTSAVWFADQMGRYPLAGTAKLPIAAWALAEVDAGRLRLNEKLRIGPDDLSPPPSRINDEVLRTRRDLFLPVADLVGLSIQHDDATASDTLMRRVGGPAAVTAWLEAKGIHGMRIDRYDRDRLSDMLGIGPFRREWARPEAWEAARDARAPAVRQAAMDAYLADSRDTSTSPAAVTLLAKLAGDALVSVNSTAFLLRLMTDGETGGGLEGGLPKGASVARVAAATPTEVGFTAADDELAVVTLAGGTRLAVAIFLAGSTATAKQRADLFGRIGALLARATNPR